MWTDTMTFCGPMILRLSRPLGAALHTGKSLLNPLIACNGWTHTCSPKHQVCVQPCGLISQACNRLHAMLLLALESFMARTWCSCLATFSDAMPGVLGLCACNALRLRAFSTGRLPLPQHSVCCTLAIFSCRSYSLIQPLLAS